jgi:hypothetical protein
VWSPLPPSFGVIDKKVSHTSLMRMFKFIQRVPTRLYNILIIEAVSSFGSFFTFVAGMALYIELTGDTTKWFWVPLVKAVVPLLTSGLSLKLLRTQPAPRSIGILLALNIVAIAILAIFRSIEMFFIITAFMAWLDTLAQPYYRQWASEQVQGDDLLSYNLTGESMRWLLFTLALGGSGLITAHYSAFWCYWVDVVVTAIALVIWIRVYPSLKEARIKRQASSQAASTGMPETTQKPGGMFGYLKHARWDILFGTPIVTVLCITYWSMNTISAFQGGLALPFVEENGWIPIVTHSSYMYAMLALGGLIAFALQQIPAVRNALNRGSLKLLAFMVLFDAFGAAGKVWAGQSFMAVLMIQAIFGVVITFLNAMLNTTLQRMAGPEHTGEVFGILVTVQKSLRLLGYAASGLLLSGMVWGGHWGFLISSGLELVVAVGILMARYVQNKNAALTASSEEGA